MIDKNKNEEMIKINLVQGEKPLNDWFFSSKVVNDGKVVYSLYDDKKELVETFTDPIDMEFAIIDFERKEHEQDFLR